MDFRALLRYKNTTMFRMLKGIFRRESVDPDTLREERWVADFSKPKRSRFREETGDGYAARFVHHGLELRIDKKHLLAWVEDPVFRYADVVVEADFRFGPATAYAAAGLFFRHADAGSYYAVLASNKGMFRLDAVFNGNPLPLIGWTELPVPKRDDGHTRLLVVAHGDRLTIVANDSWAAEVVDGTLSSGHLAFALANYGDGPRAETVLTRFRVESRPIEVEAAHFRWNSYIRVDPAARLRLAETFRAMGQHLSALVQIKRAWKAGFPVEQRELLAAADCALALNLAAEAEEYLDRCIERDHASEEAIRAIVEKAKLLYIANRFSELREHAEEALTAAPGDPVLRTLLAHAYWNLGAWERASAAYEAALDLERDNGLLWMNAGSARERLGDHRGAFDRYLEAARLFLAAEAYNDLDAVLPLLESAAPHDPRVHALAGKRAFAADDFVAAERRLSAAAAHYDAGPDAQVAANAESAAGPAGADSAVYYLLGLIRSRNGKRGEALRLFERAAALERDYAPYLFRVAEARFLLDGDPTDERLLADLEAARQVAPEDGWIANLGAQIALARGDLDQAEALIERASRALPEESAVLANRAELSFLRGDADGALAALGWKDGGLDRRNDPSGALANAAGNMLVRAERWEEADLAYSQALAAAPADTDYLRNRASCLIELGRYGEADDCLSRAAALDPGPRTLDLIAYVSIKKGEYPRAEAAYRIGLERHKDDPSLLAGLAWVYLTMARWKQAEEVIRTLETRSNAPTVTELRARLEEFTTRKVACSLCDRSWRVAVDLLPLPPLRLVAEPPDHLPAGTCPSCGKTYCIACGKKHLVDGRFVCPDCGERLKLLDEGLKKLLADWAASASASPAP